jgi:ABC-type transport system substrate-binding protein/DNA-binding beta-propeller fold protein YncE
MTDIVGSTEHAAELGDSAWRELITLHNATVRRALKRHSGRELDTAGDGFFAVFDAPADAIACALEAISAVKELGIEIRAGAHVGEVEEIGRKVGGITVPIAARIMSEAAPSELLVSGTVRELTAGTRLTFEDRGSRALKGVPGEWHLYAVASAQASTILDAESVPAVGERRAAAVRRARARPIWRRRPRATLAVLVALALIVGSTGLLAWQPWLKPALAAIPDNSVGLIETRRNVITAAIEVGEQPGGAVVADGALWVTNTGANTVSQISLASQTVARIIDVGRGPIGIAATPGSVWVANSGSRTLSQISTETARVVNEVEVGNGPTAVAAGVGHVWVANAGDSSVIKIDPSSASVVEKIPVAARPTAIVAGDLGVWVASADNASLTHIDPATGVTLAAPISLGALPVGMAQRSGEIWVATADGTIARIDPVANRVLDTVDTAGTISSIAANDDAIWVAHREGMVLRIDPGDLRAPPARVGVSSSPEALVLAGNDLWVATRPSPLSHRGGTLRITYVHRPKLDPLGFPDANVSFLQADGLVGYRHVAGVLGATLLPDLATALPQPTNGGLTYSFPLRPNLVYSNGEPVRATDFRRALERVFGLRLDEIFYEAEFYALDVDDSCFDDEEPTPCDLSRAVVVDDESRTVTFNLIEQDPNFLYKLALPAAFPVPEGVPLDGEVEGAFPGTGPYVVSEVTETQVRLARNQHFRIWDPDVRPDGYPDEIVWTAGIEPADQIAMVDNGQIDFMPLRGDNRLTPDEFANLRTRHPAQLQFASKSVTAAFFNQDLAPFDNREARQAINMAVDRAHVADLLGGPLAVSITCQVLPPGWFGYEPYCPYTTHPDPGGQWRAPNLDAARELIARSGTQGAHVVVGPVRERHAELRDYLVSVLTELGYDADADTRTDDDSVFGALGEGMIQIGVFEFFTASASASEFMVPFTCFGGDGTTNYCDSGYDDLFVRARALQAQDIAAAAEAWAAVDRAAVDAALFAPLVNSGSDFLGENVGNYQFNPSLGVLLDQLWVQ